MNDEANRAIVNDHAVVRFLERVYGLDVEAIRAELVLATAHGREAGRLLGAPQFAVVLDHVRFVVDHGQVVTALGRDQHFHPKGFTRSRKPR